MKPWLIAVMSFSILLNTYLLIREIDLSSGGGSYEQSPDMKHTVSLSSLKNSNPLASDKSVYAKITLREGFIAGELEQTFIVSPIKGENDMEYRYLEKPIEWSTDSQTATVTTPDFTLLIKLNKNGEQAGK